MNSHTANRQYKKYIQRIDEMERILRFLFEEINKLPGAVIVKNKVENFLQFDNAYQLDRVEESLKRLYDQFVKFRDNNLEMQDQKLSAIEERAVAVAATKSLLPDFGGDSSSRMESSRQGLLDRGDNTQESDTVVFSNVAGIISQVDQEKFARTIFRATRGNAYTHFETITEQQVDSKTGKHTPVMKSVFVIYHQGTMLSAVAERIIRICQAFGVRKYSWPRNFREAEKRISELTVLIGDKSHALEAYEEYFIDEISVLLEVVRAEGNSLVEEWRLFCLKERALYATLNLFEGSDATLRADCWYPAAEAERIHQLLMSNSSADQVSAFLLMDRRQQPKSSPPPTYFRCPEFTSGFQDFVNTYGVPRYKEANPALTTIVTLPFLFGIMYGDVGHGMVILLAGLYMVLMWHKKLKYSDSELVHMIGGGRFMVLLMGIFATYAGFLYNDFFALGMDIFGTRYVPGTSNGEVTVMNKDPSLPIYPFGFDPVWKGATNEIDFFNSFKMKFAVIIAFVQMGTGVLHKGSNAIYFNDSLTLWFEFVPQLLFLSSLVGYMDFLIVYKWVTDLHHPKPNIITTIINMFFFKSDEPFWTFQGTIQALLVTLMVVCIPWMLLPKPLLLKKKHEKLSKRKQTITYHQSDEISILKSHPSRDHHSIPMGHTTGTTDMVREELNDADEDFNFAEELIHQMIETIEFVLGAISNTASYLRLWALSLAHQQLALVFFENTVLRILKLTGINVVVLGIMTFIAFGAFAMVTLGVMLGMDSLECFLHALRLQWVEFQNKFFKADGTKFEPFSIRAALADTIAG